MIRSLELNQLLYSLLKNQTDCGDKLYPLLAENGTSYPFIVYTRDNVTSEICKDGVYEDQVSFTVNTIASTYFQSIDIAQTVRDLLSKPRIEVDGIIMRNSTLTGASERFEDDAYVQSLNFTAVVTNS